MKKLLPVLVLGFIFFQSCHKMKIGFLQAEYAGYAPDSLPVKAELDTSYTLAPNPEYDLYISWGMTPEFLNANGIFAIDKEYNNVIDINRFKKNMPWLSTPIQGLKGTAPIKLDVTKITPSNAESEKLKSKIDIRGSSGVIGLPLDHGIAPGRYKISLRFSNESWLEEKEDIFTIIIE